MIRNARSFLRSTWEKNWLAADCSMPIRFSWLRLTSTSMPMVSGRSVSFVKYLMVCGLPSSRMVKSSLARLGISAPFLSRTLVRTLTTSTSTLIEGRGASCFCASSAAQTTKRNVSRINSLGHGKEGLYIPAIAEISPVSDVHTDLEIARGQARRKSHIHLVQAAQPGRQAGKRDFGGMEAPAGVVHAN